MPLLATKIATLFLGAMMSATAAARGPMVVHHRTELGGWRLDIARDAFSGAVSCRLRDRHDQAFYEGDALGFRFGRSRDVGAAVYRIDGGAPRLWRDDLPELIALGTPIGTGAMANPDAGIVRVPWRLLAAANAISIQPAPGRRPRTFRLGGVHGLRQLALERGCVPATRFVR